MGRALDALRLPVIDRQSLRRLEHHFIDPDIYRRGDLATRQSRLASVVSSHVIPRLLHLHAEVVPEAPPVELVIEALAPDNADISALAHIVLGPDLEAAAAYVVVLRDRGLSLESLFIELLEPTARCLGTMWDRDECDFIDVTLGVARLQKLLAIFNDTHGLPSLDVRRRVMMAAAPGNQHTFGLTMVEKFLRAAGWQVTTELGGTREEIVATARYDWFAVAGLTAGADSQIDGLAKTIAELRRQSKNPAIGVMVGGPMFTANPALVREIGADATAPNAPAAVLVAQKLFDHGALQARAG